MSISMYLASVPRVANALVNLDHLLQKAEAHVVSRKLEESALIEFRLYPDMLPMRRQVQIACDTAKGVVARLAGVEVPVHDDNERTLAQLRQRTATTIEFVRRFTAAQIDGSENRDVVLRRADKETHYKGMQFLLGHALPNLYFHVTTTYNILRHNGVEIGKRDYLGTI